jgi:hypothetical protein
MVGVMVWYVFIVLSAVTGALPLPRWSVLLWPLVSIGLGADSVATEVPNYGMHGFGYLVGAAAAVLCAIAWLGGRGLASHARRGGGRNGSST